MKEYLKSDIYNMIKWVIILFKFFRNIGLILLVIASFFYTERISSALKEYDSIMIEIKKEKKNYGNKLKNPVIKKDTIIPGICERKVNVLKSYNNMRQFGKYDYSLYVYDLKCPNEKVINNKDKYIIKGSKENKVSLIVKTNEILNTHDNITVYTNNKQVMKSMITTHTIVSDNNKYLHKILGSEGYCILESKNKKVLKSCYKNDYYTIIPNIILKNNSISELYKKVESGSIILATKTNYKQIINYLKRKGYEIISLKEMIEE